MCIGSTAARRAAEAARPEPPRPMALVTPTSTDRMKQRGSGWGNMPRPLTRCCMAEQVQLDTLVLIAQEHALTCGAPLQRVACDDAAFWSCHSMGVVNVYRLCCEEVRC